MRPVLRGPGLSARLVELPAGTNKSLAGAALLRMGQEVPVDIPADGRCRLGPPGDVAPDLDFIPWDIEAGQGDTVIGELGKSPESPGPRA